MNSKLERMKELILTLDKAAKAYYQDAEEIISNFEYDKLYDELVELEKETNIVMAGSPTVSVGYEVLSELPKENHAYPMLSLDKTKEVAALADWLGEKEGILSWKLDGLTIVLTYQNGELVKAVTRGNGVTGEVITNNAKTFKNLPLRISYKGELVLRGEAVIKYSDFEAINQEIDLIDAKYKNPRNLCSGSVRQLNSEITAKRNVHFFAFALVQADGVDFKNSREEQRKWLASMGFEVVEGKMVQKETIEQTVLWFSKQIEQNDFPSDGLVLIFDDISYGQSLGRTAKFPKDSIAFKWADEIKETKLTEVEWSASRTGLINPVAIFEPVELEGTTVSRASLHNISIVENLELGIGDTITVYKANMIIPQIAENLTKSGNLPIPEHCPVCEHETVIKNENGVKALYCINKECLAKKVKSLTLFVSRDAMNIEGLSEATLEKLINIGIIKEIADIYKLNEHKDMIVTMEGFGEKSFQNMMDSIEKSRKTNVVKFLYSLGIPNIGLSNAKLICKEFGYEFEKIRHAKAEQLIEIQGVGEVIAKFFEAYFEKEENNRIVDDLLKEIHLEEMKENKEEQSLEGLTFVITGSVHQFANRNEVKAVIEEKGGKVTGSVTSKTNYLINNDIESNSSKNKKAKELGVPIITEQEFIDML
ncbi:NAD-dependent DNA ligase LigA [Velocimicrobium porci]|uniref:DNA ligase n=1 Tax=Velocimicrobium porci TaxID=2606634 RepID=A0A6L5XW77_9FIRM|nr:NAD-dependent DNA ligase LigA [Velocimicrobium porci]MSS63090.1 NAD-dependent DNA ligase LigA [Velocimicrobium porci]